MKTPETTRSPARRIAKAKAPVRKKKSPAQASAATTEESPAESGEGTVVLDLRNKNALQVGAFSENHEKCMAGNPRFPQPEPPAQDFSETLANLQQSVQDVAAAESILRTAYEARDNALKAMKQALRRRAAYVQMASLGSTTAIISSGLRLRRKGTRLAQLPAPHGLTLEPNGATGYLKLRWLPVPKARIYLVRYTDDSTSPQVIWQTLVSSRARHDFTGLKPGREYTFQVCALGGATGQSHWSPEVRRMAA